MQVEGTREPVAAGADVSLQEHRERQELEREAAGKRRREHGLVFASNVGTRMDVHNVRRAFRKVLRNAELKPKGWTLREPRSEDGLSPKRNALPERMVMQTDAQSPPPASGVGL
ncbi:hypothetical protein ACWDR1_05605 [Streptosporangium sandarakinum]